MDQPAVIRALVEWATRESSVRAALLVGSRAETGVVVDHLSDYDLVLFLRDPSVYADTDEWLRTFGPILVMLPERYELLGHTVPTRLVQYERGLRIDFSLCALALLQDLLAASELPAMLDAGYRILIDRDQLLSGLGAPSGRAFVPRRPTEAEFRRVVNEFWWESIYVARHLARRDLLPARYSGECVLRFECLLPMLEWHVEAKLGWSTPLRPHGRGLEPLLGDDEHGLLEATYAGAGVGENWDALHATCALFMRLASEVGDDLGFDHAAEEGRRVTDYLHEIRERAINLQGD